MALSRGGLSYRVDEPTAGDEPAGINGPSAADGPWGQTIFLVHGVGSAAATWWRLRPLLAARYRVVSYDLRGHGRSFRPKGPWSVEDLAHDHLDLVAEVGPARSHLVGFSLGAVVAMAVALESPASVDHLVLLNCAGARQDDDRARVADRLARVMTSAPSDIAAGSATRWFTERFCQDEPAVVEQEVDLISSTDPEMYRAAYQVLATTDLSGAAHRLAPPTLLVTGEQDGGSTPHMSEALAALAPQARACVLSGLRHYLHLEAPTMVADLVTGFIGEQGGP